MAKERTSVSIEGSLLKQAQLQGINVSGILESTLRKKLIPKKQDLEDDLLHLKCTQCLKEISYGYLCEQTRAFLCEKCQENFKMNKCKHDKFGEHEHIRIPGLEGQRKEKIKEIISC